MPVEKDFLSTDVFQNAPHSSATGSAANRLSVDASNLFRETYSKIIFDEFQESEESLIHRQTLQINKILFAQFINLKTPNKIDLGHLATILERGASVNFSDREGHTVLHEVARNWHVDVASFLVERGAEVNHSNIYGRTPLHVAASANNVEIVQFLIQKGAKVDKVAYGDLVTPMHCAAKNDAVDAIVCLCDHHANIHKRDFKQRTPLFLAATYGYNDSAMMLLKMGASATVEDDTGFSCLMEMIIKMPTVAKYALDQLHIIDEAGKKQHYYLTYITPTCDTASKTECYKNLLEIVLITKCYAVVDHPVLKKLINLKWKKYGLKTNQLLILMDFIFILTWSTLMILHKWKLNYYSPQNMWALPLSILCIGEMLFIIVVEIREFLTLKNAMRKWKKWRKDQVSHEQIYCHSRWPQEEINLKKQITTLDLMKDYYFLDWWHAHDCIVLTSLLAIVCSHLFELGMTGNLNILRHRLIALSLIPLWLKNMKHLRAFRFIGPIIIRVIRMMLDVAKFLFVYFEFYFAFIYSLWLLFGGTLELKTLDPTLFFIVRNSVWHQWNQSQNDEDLILMYIITVTYIGIMTFLCFILFTALMIDAYMRIQENLDANVLMQRINIILQAENRWHYFLHQEKNSDFILEHCSPLEVRYPGINKQRTAEMMSPRDNEAKKKARLSESALRIKEMLSDCIYLITGIPEKNEEKSKTILLQPKQQTKNKKLAVLQKDLLILQQEMGTLQSQQDIIDEDLRKAMDQLLEKVQRLCEQRHNKTLKERVHRNKEYQDIQSREVFLRKKLQSVNHYLKSKGLESKKVINQQRQTEENLNFTENTTI